MKNKLIILVKLVITFFPSNFRILILNKIGCNISHKAIIKPFAIVLAKDIVMEPKSQIDNFVIITGVKTLRMGAYSKISRFTMISGSNELVMECRALIGSRCILQVGAGNIRIGEYSVVAPRSTIYTHGVFLPSVWGYSGKSGDVLIGDLVWVMQNCNISPRVEIESNVIVLPGSTVLKNVLSGRMIKDDGITRKEFPESTFKRKVTEEWLIIHISGILERFIKTNFRSIHLIEKKQNLFSFEFKNKNLRVWIGSPETFPDHQNDSTCIFWYNLNNRDLDSQVINYYDFLKLVYKCEESFSEFTDYFLKWVFFEYGLQFMSVEYSSFSKLEPQPFIIGAKN